MSAKHSPGPWRWRDDKDLDQDEMSVLEDSKGNVVCDFGDDANYYPTAGSPPDEADAHLIAAAPELLAVVHYASERGEGDAEMARAVLDRMPCDCDACRERRAQDAADGRAPRT